MRDAVKKKLPKEAPKPGKFRVNEAAETNKPKAAPSRASGGSGRCGRHAAARPRIKLPKLPTRQPRLQKGRRR